MANRVLEMALIAKDKASAAFNKVSGAFGKLAAGAKVAATAVAAIAAAFAIAGAAVIAGAAIMIKAADAAETQRLAVSRLELSLKNIGKFTPEASQEMQNFASSLQQVTVVGDEMILAGMAQISMLGELSGDALKKATVASLDLSAAIGVDFQTASMLMARAAAGNTAMLSRYGITLETTGDKQKDFENLLALIEEKMGGSAALATDSFTGKVKQLKNAWGDTIEKLGEGVNESERLQEIIQKVTEWLAKNGDKVQEFGEKIADFGADAIEFLIDKFLNMQKFAGEFMLVLSRIADRMATLAEQIGLPTDAIRAMSSEASLLAVQLFRMQDETNKARAAAEAHKESIDDERDAMLEMSGFVDSTAESFVGLEEATTNALVETIGAVEEFVPEFVEAGTDIGTGFVDGIADAYSAEIPKVEAAVKGTIESVSDSLNNLTATVEITRAQLIGGITQTFGLVAGVGAARTFEEFTAATRAAVGFADEGIAMKPTFAKVGENEPEAILKISRLKGLLGGGGNGGGRTQVINLNINGGVFTASPDQMRVLARELIPFEDEERARG